MVSKEVSSHLQIEVLRRQKNHLQGLPRLLRPLLQAQKHRPISSTGAFIFEVVIGKENKVEAALITAVRRLRSGASGRAKIPFFRTTTAQSISTPSVACQERPGSLRR